MMSMRRAMPAGAEASSETCASGTFGSTPYLEGVQTLKTTTEPLSFGNFQNTSLVGDLQGLFVYPMAKWAMCTIEKNGCSAWLKVFERMMTGDVNTRPPDEIVYTLVKSTWSEVAATEVFRDPRSVRVLWVRDPLQRFLSGFLNKCMSPHDIREFDSNCPFRLAGQGPGFPLSWVQSWLRTGRGLGNGHFTPQSWHCELSKRLHEYNVIGLMSHGDFAKNAACILELAGLSRLNRGADGQPFFKEPRNPGALETSSTEVLKKFFTKEFAHEMLDVFQDDYDLFRLKRPTWVDEATGEWFDRAAEVVESTGDADRDAVDDIVSAAQRAGF